MPLKPFHNCFRATSKRNHHFLPQEGQKSQFWPKSVFPLVWVVIWCPCRPISRALVSKEEVSHAVEAIGQVFQGRQDLKKVFFRPKVPKNAYFLGQISVF